MTISGHPPRRGWRSPIVTHRTTSAGFGREGPPRPMGGSGPLTGLEAAVIGVGIATSNHPAPAEPEPDRRNGERWTVNSRSRPIPGRPPGVAPRPGGQWSAFDEMRGVGSSLSDASDRHPARLSTMTTFRTRPLKASMDAMPADPMPGANRPAGASFRTPDGNRRSVRIPCDDLCAYCRGAGNRLTSIPWAVSRRAGRGTTVRDVARHLGEVSLRTAAWDGVGWHARCRMAG